MNFIDKTDDLQRLLSIFPKKVSDYYMLSSYSFKTIGLEKLMNFKMSILSLLIVKIRKYIYISLVLNGISSKRSEKMKKSLLFIVFIFMFGCVEDPNLIKDVKDMAFVSVSFDMNALSVEREAYDKALLPMVESRKSVDLVTIDQKGISVLGSLTEKERRFFGEFTNELILTAEEKTDIKYVDVEDFYDEKGYERLSGDGYGGMYLPKPFRYVDLNNIEAAKQLCDELGVDAVAACHFKYLKVKDEDPKFGPIDLGIIPFIGDMIATEKLVLIGKLRVVDYEGRIIFGRDIKVTSDSTDFKLKIIGDVVSYNLTDSPIFWETKDSFISKVVYLINQHRSTL
jgi:hypothetical protein